MIYTELATANNLYKLRLSAKQMINLEKALGNTSPVEVLIQIDSTRMPKVNEVIVMLHYMLQDLQHNIDMEKTFSIYDEFISDNHTIFDFIPIFIDVLSNCGYIVKNKEDEDEGKN